MGAAWKEVQASVGWKEGFTGAACHAPGVAWQPLSPHPPRDLQTHWPWAPGTHVAALGSRLSLAPGDLGQLFSDPHLQVRDCPCPIRRSAPPAPCARHAGSASVASPSHKGDGC